MASTPLLSTVRHEKLPRNYIRPEAQRPRLSEVLTGTAIPVIDLSSPAASAHIGDACRSYGFFQVVNHGVDPSVMASVLAVTREFFQLPEEEKAKLYSDDPERKTRLSTSFNVRKEAVRNWRDYLRLHCHPLHDFLPHWPSSPPAFKEIMSAYCVQVRRLGFELYGAISESLGLEKGFMEEMLGGQEQQMAVNYYPPCPAPELTLGLPPHTDPNVLTVLLMDDRVDGLQILHDGRWIAVHPLPGALVVNIGDQLEALSNGAYKSVCHRAVVNTERERISVASFLCPRGDVLLGPVAELVGVGDRPAYRKYRYEEYYKVFWSKTLDHQSCLDFFRA